MKRRPSPDKSHILTLPPFEGLPLQAIRVPKSDSELGQALSSLTASSVLGFDTESKPTFQKGQVATGPEVVQFATSTEAFLLQLWRPNVDQVVREVLANRQVLKVGFGVQQDQYALMRRLGCRAQPLLDIDLVFHAQGYPRSIGVKAAIALMFARRLMKSKKVSTSNWATPELSDKQCLYASNDAYAALKVFEGLRQPVSELPLWTEGLPLAQPRG